MADIKDRAREYIAKHSEYSEVFGRTFVAVDTMTAMVEFAEQETKELKEQIAELSKHIVELQKDKGELIYRCRELETRCNELFLQTMQLTNAKFLLKQLVYAFPKSYSDVVKDTLKQAEQFISEVEE